MKIDPDLKERMVKYDKWVDNGEIPTASKVIPISQSLTNIQWILPTNQVLEILKNSKSFAITNCGCRTKYKKCDNPIETCFYLNDAADKLVRRKKARYISLEEAKEKLKLANKQGLIHLTIYHPKHQIKALCSCCECCCHDLQIMRNFKRSDYISHSDYITEQDKSSCINCGLCVQRCIFSALSTEEAIVTYNSEKCYGCGLCTTTCSTNSISLKQRTPKK